MITKEELKNEVDKLPDNLLDQVYSLLQRIILPQKIEVDENYWVKWKDNLDAFTPDFMDAREQPMEQSRESI